jgi:acyl dehydratase
MASKTPVVLERECDRYRPIYYAAASGDFNPIHLDREVAQAVGLPGNILHGMCTMAWAAEAAIDALGGDPGDLKSLQVRFSRPVKIDDRITFTAELGANPAAPGRIQINAVNQDGQEVLKNAAANAPASEAR